MLDLWIVIAACFAGIGAGYILCFLPGVHVSSLMSILVLLCGCPLIDAVIMPVCLSMVTVYAIAGFIPTVFMTVPDESLYFTVSAAQRYLSEGLGRRAVFLGATGAFAGIILTFSATVAAQSLLPFVFSELRPHFYWIIWAVVLFMLMSEWPQRVQHAVPAGIRIAQAWDPLIKGVFIFVITGAIGSVVFFASPVDEDMAFASLMPMLTGIFSLPALVYGLADSSCLLPDQHMSGNHPVPPRLFLRGCFAGFLAGALSVAVPGVTAGVGGLIAGHVCGGGRRSSFIIAQGASRGVYMTGGLLLLFVPTVTSVRGAAASMLSSVYSPDEPGLLWVAAAVILFSAGVALLFNDYASGIFIKYTQRIGRQRVSAISIAVLVLLNYSICGSGGLLILGVSFLTGMTAIALGVRRLNCLGCILVPTAIALGGKTLI